MKSLLKLSVFFSIAIGIAGCDVGCDNEVVTSMGSPEGAKNVVVFNRGCGATTGFNTQVSVVPKGVAIPSGAGNALILEGAVPLTIIWLSESAISIAGLGSAHVYKRQASVAGASITYEK